MLWTIDPNQPMPIYAQIVDVVRRAVATGHLAAGDQLPTVRQLAVELKVNPNTIARAYGELERAGIIATRQGRGTFVLDAEAAGSAERDPRLLTGVAERALLEAQGLGFLGRELIAALDALVMPADAASGGEGS